MSLPRPDSGPEGAGAVGGSEDAIDDHQKLQNATVALAEGMHFVGSIDDFRVDVDADESVGGTGVGPQPLRLLLLSVASCTAMDVVSILRKKRQHIAGLSVEARGAAAEGYPKSFERVEIVYRVRGEKIDPRAVERAIELSETRYCPVIAMVGKAAEVSTRYEIEDSGHRS